MDAQIRRLSLMHKLGANTTAPLCLFAKNEQAVY